MLKEHELRRGPLVRRARRTCTLGAFVLGLGAWQTPALAQAADKHAIAAPRDDAQTSWPGSAVASASIDAETGEAQPAAADPPPTEAAAGGETPAADADPPTNDPPALDAPLSAAADAPPTDTMVAAGDAPARAAGSPAIDPLATDAPMSAAADLAPADQPAVDAQTEMVETAVPDLTEDVPPTLQASSAVTEVAAWVVATDDNGALPFVIIDKVAASILVFDADGRLQGEAPALLGLAPGDDSAAGVGDRKLSAIKPSERTTPAGRFVAKFGAAAGGHTVLWVDWADAISLHPVVTSNPKEHRLERIRSAEPADHRISYGCINVPAEFY